VTASCIRSLVLPLALAAVACRPAGAPSTAATPASSPAMAEMLRVAESYRNPAITSRRITHAEYWKALESTLSSPRLRVEEVGRSMHGRELRTITFGSGPTKVLLWSQMHGDESTATMALADVLAWMAAPEPDAVRDRIARALTVVMLPMLNPDGAERFQRQNVAGIDINRDARRLASPEARTLKAVRDRLVPDFGFNLHDQNARTRVGRNGLPAAIALLAPAAEPTGAWSPGRIRARLVAAGLARNFESQIPGRVSKYDDAFNPRAFGDLMQAWGASTVLIESGSLPDDPEKQALRRLNAAAILLALDGIATGAYAGNDAGDYERLAYNTGGAYDLLVRGGQLVIPGQPPMRADIAVNYDDAVARTRGRVREVGDLETVVAIDTVDASGAFVHVRPEALSDGEAAGYLTIGAPALFDVREGADPASPLRRRIE